MVKDPVCGMEVNEEQVPHKSHYMGETHYFCSESCKNTFESTPEKYAETFGQQSAEKRKVVVVDAGQVGSTFSFALMISGLASTIVLIDRTFERSEGHVMDLNHGVSFVSPSRIFAGIYADCKGTDIVIATSGVAQKPGESRLDLVRKNTAIFKHIIPKVAEQNPDITLIVSNPVDILIYVALKISGYLMNLITGSGPSLDTARFRFLRDKTERHRLQTSAESLNGIIKSIDI